MGDVIRARQRSITALSPHQANMQHLVPSRPAIVPVFAAIGVIPNGNVGVPVRVDLSSFLNIGAGVVLTVTSGALPLGIAIVGLTLQGTPTTNEATAFDLTATNSAGADASSATWTIDL